MSREERASLALPAHSPGLGREAGARAMIRRTLKKHVVVATLLSGLFFYVGSYLWRSTHGRYEPAAIGLNGVKWYHWAPSGFVADFRWNRTLMGVYHPLFFLDTRFWHTSDEACRKRYPINEVATEDIGKVYRAWKR